MVQKFVANLFLVIIANLLVKPYWVFGVDRVVQNTVGTDAYGLYYALFNLSLLPTMLLDAGLNQYNNNTLAKHPERASSMFSHIFPAKLGLMLLYIIIVLVLGISKGFKFSSDEWTLLVILGLNQVFAFFILYIRTHFTGLHLFKTDTFFSVLDKTLMIGFCSLLLYTNMFGSITVSKFASAQLFAYLITTLLGLIILLPYIKPFKFAIDKQMLKEVFRKSYPFALLAVMMAIYNRADVVILESMHPQGDTQAGIYAKCYRLLDAFNMLAVLAAGLLMPMFARMIKQRDDIQPLVQTAFIALVIPASVVVCFCLFQVEPVLDLLYHGNFGETEMTVFVPVVLCIIPMAMNYIFGSLLTATGNIKILNRISLFAVTINLIGNYIFIPKYGAIGTGYVAMATQLFAVIGTIYFCMKKLQVKISSSIILKYLLLIVLIGSGLYALVYIKLNISSSFLIVGLGSAVLMYALKLVQPKAWMEVFKQLKN
ncbi:MAG: oligosaccharide flippase family protein [Bacteroidota bacterium]|nr:oligosaccharide flippase family protein [Bacteroidota bacterium]